MAIVLSSTTQTAEQLQETLERAEQRRNPSFGEAAEPAKEETSGETVTESPAVEEGETEEHKPSRRSQKVKRLAEKLAVAERERDELREKYETTQQRRAETASATESEDEFAYPVPKPKAADYPNDPQAFVEALTDWKADEREYRNGAQAAKEAAQEAHRETSDAYNARIAESGIEDFYEVVSKSPLKIWPEVQQALLEHESGHKVVYYLAKHPETAQKLAEMRPARAVAEVGVIASSLNASKSPETKLRPKLITPVGGTVVTEASREKMSFRDYRRGRRNGTIE